MDQLEQHRGGRPVPGQQGARCARGRALARGSLRLMTRTEAPTARVRHPRLSQEHRRLRAHARPARARRLPHRVGDPSEADIAVVNTCAFLTQRGARVEDTIARVAGLKQSGRLRGLDRDRLPRPARGGDAARRVPRGRRACSAPGSGREVVRAARHVLDGEAERFARAPTTPAARSIPTRRARCRRRAHLALPQDLRGLRPSLHVLHHPAAARRPAQRPARPARRRGRAARRRRRARAEPDRPGHDGLRHRPARPPRRSPICSRRSTTVDGLTWIRVQYTYPRLWSDRLIDVWARGRRIVPYVDMPLQHIAPDMLRRMARAHDRERDASAGAPHQGAASRTSRSAPTSSSASRRDRGRRSTSSSATSRRERIRERRRVQLRARDRDAVGGDDAARSDRDAAPAPRAAARAPATPVARAPRAAHRSDG